MPRKKVEKPASKLTGSVDPGYTAMAEGKKLETPPKEILEDPDVVAALRLDRVEEDDNENLELQGRVETVDPYADMAYDDEIGNGTTLPFRYRGRPSLKFTTCSEPEKDKNRGCPMWYRCPLRDLGSGNLVLQDKRTGQIRHSNCYDFIATHMARDPKVVLLPGVEWAFSYDCEYEPWPDGRPVELGPGKPKPAIRKIPTKNPIVAVFDADLVRQYQVLRRRGEVA